MDITVSVALITAGSTLGAIVLGQLFQALTYKRNQTIAAKVQHKKDNNKSRELVFKELIGAMDGFNSYVRHYLSAIKKTKIQADGFYINGSIYYNFNTAFAMIVNNKYVAIRKAINDTKLYASMPIELNLNKVLVSATELINLCLRINESGFKLSDKDIDEFNNLSDDYEDIVRQTEISLIATNQVF
ncbi:MAG: hypothetical protein AB7E61_06310 [Acholeplasmataceae bacterium]